MPIPRAIGTGRDPMGRRPSLYDAALTLLVLGAIPSPVGALAYLLVFGIGSTAGMLLLSGLVGLPMALAAHGAHRLRTAIQLVAGAGSAALGVWMLVGPAGA
jgi:high-affinity nickel-transport protein